MILKDLRGYVNSATRLKTPNQLTWENNKTSQWPVDKKIVANGYFQSMIIGPFGVGALSINETKKQTVMIIGLGGGTVPNFFSIINEWGINIKTIVVEIDPIMIDLATRYFDFKPVKGLTNLILADGVALLKKAVSKGVKYNVLMLDACYSIDENENGLLCPVSEFYELETIENIYKVIEEHGVLAINTVFNRNHLQWEIESKEKFLKFFAFCDYIPYAPGAQMLMCTKKAIWAYNDAQFLEKMRQMNNLFNFNLDEFL